jgi:hypothetical protein
MQIDLLKLEDLIEEDVTIQSMRQHYDELCKKIKDTKKLLKPEDDDSSIEAMKCQKKVLELRIQIEEMKIRERLIWDTHYKDVNYLKYHATDEEKLKYINDVLGTHIDYLDFKTFNHIASKYKLSLQFIDIFIEEFDLSIIIQNQKLTENFIEKHERLFKPYWSNLCREQQFSMDFLKKHHIDVDWKLVAIYQDSFRVEVLGLESSL